MNEKKLYHLGFDHQIQAKYAIITGDPFRVPEIAELLEGAEEIAFNREYRTCRGMLAGAAVFVTSHGIGGPSTAIAVEELYMAGVRTIIRVGTSGGIRRDVLAGHLVIASAAVRMDGTSLEYAPLTIPAAADFFVCQALWEAGQEQNVKIHVGTVQSKDSFYGQHCPERMPVAAELRNNWSALKKMNVLTSEMECASLYIVASALGIRAGGVLTCVWNQEVKQEEAGEAYAPSSRPAILLGIEGLKRLIEADKRLQA